MEASDFRNGVTFVCDGQPCQVIEFQHVKPGKGAAFVRTKYKNIITGAIRETSFNPTAKFESAFIERKDMDYSYKDGMTCKISTYEGNVFAVEGPDFVELEITECEPGVAGNTATNATKPCTVETGATLNVPLFINQGEIIKIDTRTGKYLSRAK